MISSMLVLLFTSITLVRGHAIFQELYVNGVSAGHLTGIRVPDYDGPISDVTSPDVICNGGLNPYHTPLPSTIITVPAGSDLTAEFHHTLKGADPSDGDDPISAGHKGPIMAYLAQVASATQTNVSGLRWFKIYEDGLTGQTWAVDKMVANKGKVTFNVPSCIPSGEYLLRVELIALHGAGSYPGAQLYMECAQIRITGGGNASPATVSFPGAYKGSDPGITINIYYPTVTSYTIPGPRPFTCGSSQATAEPTLITDPSVTRITPPAVTDVPPATTIPSPATPGAPLYGQCGGRDWTGPTTCASGSCKSSSEYYSQCLP